jgi:hypothetical protein
MPDVDRRTLLSAITVGAFAAMTRAPVSNAVPISSTIPLGRIPAPAGVLTRLPGMALNWGLPSTTGPACRGSARSRSSAATPAPG